MKRKLSSWWEQSPGRAYVAKRNLVSPGQADRFAPLTRFIVYYCGMDFTPQRAELKQAGVTYLITGEKEPINAQEDNPWMHQAQNMLDVVGGAIRQGEPEIIPVLYASVGFEQNTDVVALSSDEVPLSEDANRIVRVVYGQYENVVHSVSVPQGNTLLDVVLKQGGVFTWRLLPGQQAFLYVVSGSVQIGKNEILSDCRADTLVWARGRNIYVSAQCAGGRFFVGTLPTKNSSNQQEVYVQEVLPDLDQVEN